VPPKQFAVAIMTRPVIAGATKTRLIARYGAQAAARIHQEMLESTVLTARAATEHVFLFVSDAPLHSSITALASSHGISVVQQVGTDLGQRMQHVFQQLQTDFDQVVLVGSDCVTHSAERFCAAAASLDAVPVVFCPAEDGGYVLVAANAPTPGVFESIDWGTSQVMEQTRSRLKSLNCQHIEFDRTWDVDEPADVERATKAGWFKWLTAYPI
jgi:uncharacterized protein